MKVAVLQQIYKSARFVEKVYSAIMAQDYPDFKVYTQVSVDDGAVEKIKKFFPQVEIIDPGENLGMCKGHNQLFNSIEADVFVLVNPDAVLEKNYISEAVKVLQADSSVGAVAGKIFKYDFGNNMKLVVFDSTGIDVYKSGRVKDRGQFEQDLGQYDKKAYITGVSGCIPVYRKSAIMDVAHEGKEVFDENFFAYYDDTDLSLRLLWRGWKIAFAKDAVAYHARTASGSQSGMKKPIEFIKHHRSHAYNIRSLSFKNQILTIIKNFPRFSLNLILRQIAWLGYVLIFETDTLKIIPQTIKEIPVAYKRRKEIMRGRKISVEEFEKYLL